MTLSTILLMMGKKEKEICFPIQIKHQTKLLSNQQKLSTILCYALIALWINLVCLELKDWSTLPKSLIPFNLNKKIKIGDNGKCGWCKNFCK
jgi:hypothetical protein